MSNKKSKIQIVRSAGIIGAATFISRILGFIRDVLIAKFFGTSAACQAFIVAFRIPNLLRDLVGEGAANAAFVPVFSEYLAKDKRKLKSLIQLIFWILLVTVSILVIVGIFCTPFIVKVIAPGFSSDPEKIRLTVWLTKIMFPYLLFIALTAFFISILHTHKSFMIPAFGPCLLNISFIVMILMFSTKLDQPVLSLALAVLIGGFLQLIMHIPAVFKKDIKLECFSIKNLNFRHPGIGKIRRMFIPRAFSAGVYQLNIFIDTICGSLGNIAGEGAVAAIYYANRIIQFPLSIFGIALSSVMLPELSERSVINDIEGLRSNLAFSIKGIIFIILPISVGIFVFAYPLTEIIFQRGRFSAYSTQITAWALLFYSLSLFAYAVIGIIRNCFYALQDTLTPVKVSFFCVLINALLNVILMFPLKVGGIALASSISAMINLILLYNILIKKIGGLHSFGIKKYILKIMLASLIMGAAANYMWNSNFFIATLILRLIIIASISLVVFILACIVCRIKELNRILRWILKR